MNKKFMGVTAALLLGSSVGMFADNIGPGLGAMLLKGKSGKGMEILGAFLNGIAFNGYFAITFGTMGYEEGAKIAFADANSFIADNFDNLAEDIAKGDGEYLDVLSDMIAVSDKVAFKNSVQANFSDIYSSADVTADEVAEKLFKLVI